MAALPYSSWDALTRGYSARGGSQLVLHFFTPLCTEFLTALSHSRFAARLDVLRRCWFRDCLPLARSAAVPEGPIVQTCIGTALHCAASASRHPAGSAARLCPRSRAVPKAAVLNLEVATQLGVALKVPGLRCNRHSKQTCELLRSRPANCSEADLRIAPTQSDL